MPNMIVIKNKRTIIWNVMQIDIHKPRKNITRFTYEFTSFQGWRVTLCRRQEHFTRYFSDKQYGSAEAALQAAIEVLEHVKHRLNALPDDPARVFEECRELVPRSDYPTGVRPRKGTRPVA